MGYKGRKGRKGRKDSEDGGTLNLAESLMDNEEEEIFEEDLSGEAESKEGYMDKLSRTVDKMKTEGISLAKSLGHQVKEGTKVGLRATREGLGAVKQGTEDYFDWVDETNEKIDKRRWEQEQRDMEREEDRADYASSRAERQKKIRDMERDRRKYEMDAELDELEHQNELMEHQMQQFQKQAEMQKKLEKFGQANGVMPMYTPNQNMGGYYGYASPNPVVQQQARQLQQMMPLYTAQPRQAAASTVQAAPVTLRSPMELLNTDYVGVSRGRPQQPTGQVAQPQMVQQPHMTSLDLLKVDYVGANNARMGRTSGGVGAPRVSNAVDFMNTNFVELNQRRMAGEPLTPQALSPTLQPIPYPVIFVEPPEGSAKKKSKK